MKVNAIISVLIFLFFGQLTIAQSQLSGTIYSGASQKPLYKAVVRSGIHSVKTDRKGHFNLKIKPGEALEIYHPRFDNQVIHSEKVPKGSNVKLYLTPTSQYKSNVIEKNNSEAVVDNDYEHVIDYAFLGEMLFVATYMRQEHMKNRDLKNCVLSAYRYGSLVQRLVMPNDIRKIWISPENKLFLLSRDIATEIYVNEENQYAYRVVSNDYLEPNERPNAKFGENYLATVSHDAIPIVQHVVMDSSGKKRVYRNVKNYDYFNHIEDDFSMLSESEMSLVDKWENEQGIEAKYFAPLVRSYYQRRNLEKPYSPAFLNGDTILVFDHFSQMLYKHNRFADPFDSVGVYHDELSKEDFVKNCQDQITNDLYTVHKTGGHTFIRPLNKYNGSTGAPFKLDKPFAKNVKVYDGYVYYLYQTPIDEKNWHLLREKLPF